MQTQEIKITASITLEVPIELSKGELIAEFECANVEIKGLTKLYISHLDVIEIEEEAQIYGNE